MTPSIDLICEPDVAVIGGGIAGMWLMNRLQSAGYECALFEKRALGCEQTLASQGMIHGGMKYALSARLTGASESIADMPRHWLDCLAGKGDVDLSGADVLSRHFYFWSGDNAASRLSTFFASKAVQGRVEKVAAAEFPSLFRDAGFNGSVYRLQDVVLDIPSVLNALVRNLGPYVFHLPTGGCEWQRSGNNRAELLINNNGQTLRVRARQFVFTAGAGNGELMQALAIPKPAMQLRPLHQVWVKHNLPHEFFGHCLGADSTPRLSISTHPCADGERVWSLGGSLAERGVKLNAEEVIDEAQRELSALFPWLDFSGAQWLARRIDRAEARQRHLLRPDKAFARRAGDIDNVIVAWPTKLTLAPNLANEVLGLLSPPRVPRNTNTLAVLQDNLQPAVIGMPPWDTEF